MNDLILSITLISVSIIILPFGIREIYRTIKEEFFDIRPSKIKLGERKAGYYTGLKGFEAY
jgi:hypothetical protein